MATETMDPAIHTHTHTHTHTHIHTLRQKHTCTDRQLHTCTTDTYPPPWRMKTSNVKNKTLVNDNLGVSVSLSLALMATVTMDTGVMCNLMCYVL